MILFLTRMKTTFGVVIGMQLFALWKCEFFCSILCYNGLPASSTLMAARDVELPRTNIAKLNT